MVLNLKYHNWSTEKLLDERTFFDLRASMIAKVFFRDEKQAYKFAILLNLFKQKELVGIKDKPEELTVSAFYYYLLFGKQLGIFQKEGSKYKLSKRFQSSFQNFSKYLENWIDKGVFEENLKNKFVKDM